jgi:putative SOS response-associated peptidase YedK
MCYYNGIKVTRNELIMLLSLEAQVKDYEMLIKPIQGGFEYQDYPIVKPVNGGKEIVVEAAHWELIPSMVSSRAALPEFRKKYNTLNAKAENLLKSPFYRSAALKRRCLVLSSGFYEWRHYKPAGAKSDVKYPYHITVPGRPYFFMAGIWQPWTDRETGETIDTFSIVTTAANSLMEVVHNSKRRMPTILPEDLAFDWMQDGLSEERIAELAAYQFPAEKMECHTIHKDFRRLPDPAEAFAYAELPEIGDNSAGPVATSSLF